MSLEVSLKLSLESSLELSLELTFSVAEWKVVEAATAVQRGRELTFKYALGEH